LRLILKILFLIILFCLYIMPTPVQNSWNWLVGTTWVVPPVSTVALSYTAVNGTLKYSPQTAQVIWQFTEVIDDYYVKANIYSYFGNYQTGVLMGMIGPDGDLQFNFQKLVGEQSNTYSTGWIKPNDGKAVKDYDKKKFIIHMQVQLNRLETSNDTVVSKLMHNAYMIMATPKDTIWNNLPGTARVNNGVPLSVPEFKSNCENSVPTGSFIL